MLTECASLETRLHIDANERYHFRCTRETVLPLGKPLVGCDGKELHELVVPKGTFVQVAILIPNRNPDFWGPDADEWKPERWLNGLPDSIAQASIPGVYSHLMTFIGGARACMYDRA